MPFKKTTLKNGLRIITAPMKGTKTVTVLVIVGAGSKYETRNINGVSHFLEHMFFKGTKKRPNTLTLTEPLDSVGGEYNAFTSKEYTGYWAKAGAKHRRLILDIISDILINSKFDPKEIDKERGVIIEEINMYQDMPMAYIADLFELLLYDDQPAGWLTIGTKGIVSSMKRKNFIDYLHNLYVAKNTLVVVAGDIEKETKSIKEIKDYFDRIQKDGPKTKKKVIERQKKPKTLVHYKKTDQTHLCLGIRTYDVFHPDRYVLEVMNAILGSFFSSRLFIQVRERRGLAYYIRSSSENYTDTGYLVAQAGVDNNKVDEAIKVILAEFNKLKDKQVSKKELKKGREYLKGKMLLNLESSDEVAFWLGSQEILKKEILTIKQVFEKVDAVTSEDIKRVALDIFQNEKLNLAVIGPFKEKSKFEKILKL